MIRLLRGLDEQARTGRLPPYLPTGADTTALTRMVQVRPDVRTGPPGRLGGGDAGEDTGSEVYQLPVERGFHGEPTRLWLQVAEEHRRLVVLADPGLGKSWLIRSETHRLSEQALARLAQAPGPVAIPIPVRSASSAHALQFSPEARLAVPSPSS